MANPEHLAMLKQGVKAWNEWRKSSSEIRPDLRRANLREVDLLAVNLNGINLNGANLIDAKLNGARMVEANLNGANLRGAILIGAKLNRANLNGAVLVGADLFGAKLEGAFLSRANLRAANLHHSDLSNATLQGATLVRASLVDVNLENANLANCCVYGISTWNLKLDHAIQSNLVITPENEPTITVDNLEIAQFVYLLLNNSKIRDVIDTIARKVVLILGRFTPERKAVLDAIREELRKRDYLPVLFDFDKPATRDITETMCTLAHLSRFIIADLSEPSSIPLELQAVVPDLAVPVQPLLLSGQREFSMFVDLRKKYHWVLVTHQYTDIPDLLASLGDKVIAPAELKARELEKR